MHRSPIRRPVPCRGGPVNARRASASLLGLLVAALSLAACSEGDRTADPRVPTPAEAATPADTTGAAAGQTVYVPVYSHVYFGDGARPVNFAVTLSVRNTDALTSIAVSGVRYYDTAGELVEAYVDRPRRLGPLATAEFVVDANDVRGGSGASFVVEWAASRPVSPAVVEAVMISVEGTQGLSLVSVGRVIRERASAPPR
ncbi:MAG TPA: DUF3124 domain-containing protein [Rubricoccaceae bacterium]